MVTRDRIQGETLQLLIIPHNVGIETAFAVFRGPSGDPVTTQATKTDRIIGYPWMLGVNGWILTDFGPTPPIATLFVLNQDTAAFIPGLWGAEVWTVDLTGAKSVLTRASFNIRPTLAASGATADVRSVAQRAVENIEAYLADPTNLSAGSYTINNRSLTRYSHTEILGLLRYWKQRLKYENIKASAPAGQIGKRINVRF